MAFREPKNIQEPEAGNVIALVRFFPATTGCLRARRQPACLRLQYVRDDEVTGTTVKVLGVFFPTASVRLSHHSDSGSNFFPFDSSQSGTHCFHPIRAAGQRSSTCIRGEHFMLSHSMSQSHQNLMQP